MPVIVSVGTVVVVTLPAHGGTGYTWRPIPAGGGVLALASSETVRPASHLLGAPVEQRFSYTARSVGRESLGFELARPGNGGATIGGTFHVLVIVDERPTKNVVAVTKADDGGSIELAVGEIISIELPEHAGTAYRWTVARNDASLLQPLGDPSGTVSAATRPGAPVIRTFRFKASGAGGVGLKLLYQSVAVPGVRAADTFSLLVSIARP